MKLLTRLISHRGNLTGPLPTKASSVTENCPNRILYVLNKHPQLLVEIDIWVIGDTWYFGHDQPYHEVNWQLFENYNNRLLCHAKNANALYQLNKRGFHCFWHDQDTYSYTNRGIMITKAGALYMPNSICMLPELGTHYDASDVWGICSDYILKYQKFYES